MLWPPSPSRAFPSGNDASVVLDVRGGGIPPTLLLGDLSASPQRAITASGALDPPYAVVKVAHHGSADQDAALYEAAEPLVAVITVGAGNDYGHPRDETIAILDALGAKVLRTDVDGVVAVSPAGGGMGALARARRPRRRRWVVLTHGHQRASDPSGQDAQRDPAAVVAVSAAGPDRAHLGS